MSPIRSFYISLAAVLFCGFASAQYPDGAVAVVDPRLSLLEHLNGEISSLRRTLPGAIQVAADAISKENAKSNLRQLSYDVLLLLS